MIPHRYKGLIAKPGGGAGGDAVIHEKDGSILDILSEP